jgi:hypothetical protein
VSRRPVIEVHIDSLVVDGLSRAEGHRIGEGLRTELARVLTGDHMGDSTSVLRAAHVVGAEVARSVRRLDQVGRRDLGGPERP